MNFSQKSNNTLTGFILVDKPIGYTSTSIVRKIKKSLNPSKVGHLGTLDPFASGLLPIMIGGATRLSEDLMDLHKQYLFTIQLGIETDTLDSTGQIVSKSEVPSTISKSLIVQILQERFSGKIFQTPPVYSALKMDGRPLYEYMRATGSLPYDISTKTREIFIHHFEFLNFDPYDKTIEVRVVCSKGTYVRCLARDIAKNLGTVGMCSKLRREKIGEFCVDNAVQLTAESITTNENISNQLLNYLIPPNKILKNTLTVEFDEEHHAKLETGNIFTIYENEDFEQFNVIKNLIENNSENSKSFFTKFNNESSPLFLTEAELIDKHSIKIKPRKKMN